MAEAGVHPVPPSEPPPKHEDPIATLAAEVEELREQNSLLKAQLAITGGGSGGDAMRVIAQELASLRQENKRIVEALAGLAALPRAVNALNDRLGRLSAGDSLRLEDRNAVSTYGDPSGVSTGSSGAGAGAGAGAGVGVGAAGLRRTSFASPGSLGGASEPPPPLPEKTLGDLKLWTGTWNVGAKDPFEGINISRNMDVVARMLKNFVPLEQDVYVLGIQEGINDQVFEAFAKYTGCYRLPLYAKLDPAREAASKARVRSRRLGHAITVQDMAEDDRRGKRPPPTTSHVDQLDRVWGRGDGAILSPKFTGIAVFVSDIVAPYVRLLGVYKHSFGAAEGSKGGVGVALGMYDVTMAFVNCHLASKKTEARRQQYMDLVERLGAKLGGRGFQLNEEFHHIVWMGDMNYHCVGINASDALALIRQGQCRELLVEYDELLQEREKKAVFYRYEEPVMSPTLFPTYKKHPARGRVKMTDPEWVRRVYLTQYKEPFYKGGRTVERVPSWTDRILFHSLPSKAGTLTPEPLDPEHPELAVDNYQSVNQTLDVSDHSPVFCTWNLQICADGLADVDDGSDADGGEEAGSVGGGGGVPKTPKASKKWSLPLVVVLKVTDVQVDYKGQMRMPRAVNLLFPLPYEDSDSLPMRAKIVRADTVLTLNAKSETREKVTGVVKATVSRAAKLPDLHMLMKVSMDDNTKAQCVISLRDGGFNPFAPGKQTFQFFEPLTSFGLPYTDREGKPVQASFQVEVSTYVDTAAAADGPLPVPVSERERLRAMSATAYDPAYDPEDVDDEPEYNEDEEEWVAAFGGLPPPVGGRPGAAPSTSPGSRPPTRPPAVAAQYASAGYGPPRGAGFTPGTTRSGEVPSTTATGVPSPRGPPRSPGGHYARAGLHAAAGTGSARGYPGLPARGHAREARIVVDVSDSD